MMETTDAALKVILDASPVGIVVFDRDARVLYANPLAERLFGRQVTDTERIRRGDFIGCARRHQDPQVCDHTQNCLACPLFRAICSACSDAPDPVQIEGEAFLDRDGDLPAIWIKYKVVGLTLDGRKAAAMAVDDITESKKNEEDLRGVLAELSVIHEHAPIAMMLVDRDRRVCKVNGFAAKFAHRPAEEMIGLRSGQALRCLHHLDDPRGCGFGIACAECRVRQAVLDTFEDHISREEIEAWLPFPRGHSTEERCLLISTAFLKIDSTERVLVCAQDITDRKRAEHALRQSEKRFRSLFNSIRDAILVADTHRTIIDYNPAFVDLFGYAPEEIRGNETQFIYQSKEEFDRMGDAIRAHMGDPAFLHTVQYKRKNGSVFPGETSVFYLRADAGDIAGFIGLIRDISKRKQAEEAMGLRTRAIESAIDGIAILDENETYVYLNPSHADLYGYDRPEELVGKTWRVLYSEDELKRFDREIMPDFRKRGFWRGEATGMKKDGSLFPQEISLTSLDNRGLICVVRNISDRIHAQKTQKNLEDQLHHAQRLESVGRLAGGIAHDFNNILQIILSYSEMLAGDVQEAHPHRKPLKEIHASALRASDLTRQLLAFSRRQTLELKTVDINKVVTGFEKLLRRLLGEDITLELALAARPLTVKADIAQLEQVLMNLAINARDAMPDGGILTIETALVALDTAYAQKKPGVTPGDYVMIGVSDTGCGMAGDTLERIFEPFFTTKGMDKGTGLGLATSYGIVKQHGGNIWVYSEPGLGTTFKVYLPLCAEPITARPKPAQWPDLTGGDSTVLVVEDEPLVRQAVMDILSRGGYRVIETDSVEAALRHSAEHAGPLHLVLTDVVMPGMKGPEVYDEICKHHPEARVLYMSGYTENVIAQQGILNAGIAFIQKPFSVTGLLEKVRDVLNRQP